MSLPDVPVTIDSTTIQPTLQVQRFYVKEKTFKAPYSPAIFQEEWKPEINIEMNIKNNPLPETSVYEVIIHFTITARNQNRTAFSIDIQQAGIFKIEQAKPEVLQHILSAYCPGLLYPYASKAIADATIEASFPALTLTPVNFEMLYQEQLKKKNETKDTLH